jgi:hypothetical protein
MSIALMKIAQQMTPSPRHRLSPTVSRAAGAGAKWMKCGTAMAACSIRDHSRPCGEYDRQPLMYWKT